MRRFLAVFFSAFLFTSLGVGQTGFPRFASIESDGFGNINRYNLNNQFSIPILTLSSRGFSFSPALSYNSLIWQKNFNVWSAVVDDNGAPTWGWGNQSTIGGATFLRQRLRCVANDGTNQWSYDYTNFDYLDQTGTHHFFNLDMLISEQSEQYPECGDGSTQRTEYAGDGSGYYLVATASGNSVQAKVYAPTGTGISDGIRSDTNGNHIRSYGVSGSETDWEDSTGRVALKVVNDTVGTPRTTTYSYRDANGAWQNLVVKLASYSIRTSFGCSGISEYANSPVWLPYEIDLPDTAHNGKYSIQYEVTPGSSGETTGRISQVNLPAGGYVSYTYGGINCDDGSPTSLTKVMNDGSTSSTWTYTRTSGSGLWSTTVNAPNGAAGNDAVYSFNSTGLPTDLKSYQGTSGGNILQEVGTSYVTGGNGIIYGYTTTTTTGNAQTKNTHNFDLYGNLTGIAEYDGTTLLRSTSFSYLGGTQYEAANIVSKLTETLALNGGGVPVARTVNTYDDYSSVGLSCITGASGHDDSNYGCSNTVRGNLTKTVQYSSPSTGTGAIATQQLAYDSLGNVVSVTDANNHSTSISYADSWGSNNPCSMSGTYAYPTLVTNALSQQTSATYNSCTGALASSKDANNQTTTFTYSDALLRQTNVGYPDGGGASYSYAPTQVTTQFIGGTSSTITTDGRGRTIRAQTAAATVDYGYGYDSQGTTQSVSNPYQGGSAPSTTTHYDAIGRPTGIDYADGTSHSSTTYVDNCVTTVDPASHSRKLCMDALGRLAQVYEDSGGANFGTSYTYNSLDQLADVLQNGSMARHFLYDGLSRMIAANNPENSTSFSPASQGCGTSQMWTACYGYDNNGNLTSKTDNRGVTVNNYYDSLNRLYSTTYSDGVTPSNYYWYDAPPPWMTDNQNVIGRLANSTNQFGGGTSGGSIAAAYSYDSMGRVIREWKQTPSHSPGGVFVYSGYDLAGNLTSLTYPDGRKVTQSFDTSGRLSTVTYDSWNGQHVGYNYASGFTYTPAGASGNTTFGNGVQTGILYNSRQQVCQMATAFPATYGSSIQGIAIDRHYYYASNAGFCAATAGNVGNIAIITDERNPGKTQGFGYDQLNRLTSASRSDGGFNYSYPIDSFGNMTQVNNLTGNPTVSFPSNNQMQVGGNAYTYDAAGNLVDTGQYGQHFTYDAESRISQVNQGSTASYLYNLQSQRARKDANGGWTEYFYIGGQTLAELHSDGTWSDYIYANGQRVAKADSFDARLHMSGVNCDNNQCGVHSSGAYLPTGNGYVVQNGDVLRFRQYQGGSAQGGLMISFSNGDITNWYTVDTDGQQLNNDGYKNQWHFRTVDLSAHAGKTISSILLLNEVGSGAGQFDLYVADISITSTNASVFSIYNRQQGLSLPLWGGAGVANLNAYSEASNSSGDSILPQFTTSYYVGDHLGTAQMEFAGGGWPVWKGEFAPYGQEISSQVTSNNYKFTGQERDSETGLDHFQFRSFASTMGRWTSPDPYLGSMDLTNPQSLNRYAYVGNRPVTSFDPTGLNEGDYWLDQFGNIWYEGAGGVLSELDTTVNVTPGSDCGFGCTSYSGSDLTSTVNPIPTSGYTGGSGASINGPAPAVSPNICTAAAAAAGAAGGALFGNWAGGVLGAAAGGSVGTLVAPGVGTVGAGIAGGAGGSAAGSWIGGGLGGAVGGIVGNILCAKGGGPSFGGNSRQNKQANDAKRDAENEVGKKMTNAQEDRFHDEVSHQNLGYWEMREIAVQILKGII